MRSQSSGRTRRAMQPRVRGQVRHPHPRQNQKPGTVGDPADVTHRASRSSHEPVRCPGAAARTPRHTRDPPPLGPDQILEVLATALVTQVMMLFHQTMEKRLVGRSPHEARQPAQRFQRHRQGRGLIGKAGGRDRSCGSGRGCGNAPAATGSRRPAPASAAGHGRPRRATRRWAVHPRARTVTRQFPAAAVGMCLNELPQEPNLLAGDLLSAVAPRFRHNRSMPEKTAERKCFVLTDCATLAGSRIRIPGRR